MARFLKFRKSAVLPDRAPGGQVRLYLKADETLETVDDEGNREPVGTGDGGSGIPQGGPLTEPLDTGEQAIVSTAGIYLIADQSVIDLQRKDAGGVVRAEILLTEGGVETTLRDAVGNPIATWDGVSATLSDDTPAVRMTYEARPGSSEDTDAAVEWTVKDAASIDKAKFTLDETGFHLEAVNVVEVPATPTAQDVVDALLALGLVTQAAP